MESESTVNNYNNNVVVEISDSSEEDDFSHADCVSYFKNLNLRYFTAFPLRMLTDHSKLKRMCLENGNLEPHYVEGVLQFFVHKEKQIGLIHLRQSAIGNNADGMYLYGLLMLAEGHPRSGKKSLDKLQWKENISNSDHCWKRIKNSLRQIPVPMKQRYNVNLVNLTPQTECDLENMAKVCKKCYYYKKLFQFVHFATNKE